MVKKSCNLFAFILVLALLPAWKVQAEPGIGVVEDPVTGRYIEEVTKDWQQGVVYNPQTGDYAVTYKTDDGSFVEVIYVPATKIEPGFKSILEQTKSGTSVSYRYKLKSGTTSQQNVSALRTEITSIKTGYPVSPENWVGRVFPNSQNSALFLSWVYDFSGQKQSLGGLAPGKSVSGFVLESDDLPGVAVMEIKGAARRTSWLGHIPEIDTPVGTEVNKLKTNDFVPRPAATPKIPNPQPFDAAAVLTSLQKHIKEDIVSMKLIDPSFAAQLDRGLQAAIDAAKRGNTAGLKEQLKDLRHLLKGFGEPEEADHRAKEKDDDTIPEDQVNTKPWPHPISKLAARVIDFDLKYIEKRAK